MKLILDTVNPKYNKGSGTGTVSLRGCLNTALSLRANTAEVTEGGTANITVNANANPLCSVRFRYSVSHTSGTNFLLPGENGTKVVDRTFSDPTPGVWTATISIRTDTVDMDFDPNGEFKVTLVAADPADAEQRYTIDTSMPNYDHIDVTVYESIKPLIKIGTEEPETIIISVTNNIVEFREEIELTSDRNPHGSLKVKFTVTETSTNTNFLKTPIPVEDTITFAAADPPRIPEVFVGKIDAIKFVDVVGIENATILLTLQDDANNYRLGTGAEKSKSITIPDPSYFRINTYELPSNAPGRLVRDPGNLFTTDNDAREAVLYILDPTVNHRVNNDTWVLNIDNNKSTVRANWYLNGSNMAEDSGDSEADFSHGTLETKIGRWILPGGDWDDRHAPHTFKDDSRFEMTSAELSEIPLDSKARIQLDVTIPDGSNE